MRVIFNATDLNRFESMIAGNPGHVGQNFVCNSSEIRFSQFFVLKVR